MQEVFNHTLPGEFVLCFVVGTFVNLTSLQSNLQTLTVCLPSLDLRAADALILKMEQKENTKQVSKSLWSFVNVQ